MSNISNILWKLNRDRNRDIRRVWGFVQISDKKCNKNIYTSSSAIPLRSCKHERMQRSSFLVAKALDRILSKMPSKNLSGKSIPAIIRELVNPFH